jgi:hypothetical protein
VRVRHERRATLTSVDGRVHRIEVGAGNPLDVRLKSARFSATLAPGSYRIRDRLDTKRGGGRCGAFLAGRHFRIRDASATGRSITIAPGKPTFVRINCFGF